MTRNVGSIDRALRVFGALLVLAAATQTWIHVVPTSTSVRLPEIDISGNDAATSVAALSVAALAAAAAATIARVVGRRIIGVILALSGIGIIESYTPVGGEVGTLLDAPISIQSAGDLARNTSAT